MKKKKKEGIGDEVYEGGGEGERWKRVNVGERNLFVNIWCGDTSEICRSPDGSTQREREDS